MSTLFGPGPRQPGRRFLPALAATVALVAVMLVARGAASSRPAKDADRLAPDFPSADPRDWINAAPLTMEGLRGRVVLIDVWTFG